MLTLPISYKPLIVGPSVEKWENTIFAEPGKKTLYRNTHSSFKMYFSTHPGDEAVDT